MNTKEIAGLVEDKIFQTFNSNKYLVKETPKLEWLNNWIKEAYTGTLNPNIIKQFKIEKPMNSEDSKKLIEHTMNSIKKCIKNQIKIIFNNILDHYIHKNKLARLNDTQLIQDNFFKSLKDKRKSLKNKKKPRLIIDRKPKNKKSKIKKILIIDKKKLTGQEEINDKNKN